MRSRHDRIMETVTSCVEMLLMQRRVSIETAILNREITVTEIVEQFNHVLRRSLDTGDDNETVRFLSE